MNGREPSGRGQADLIVTIPASLASGAHQAGEESQLVVYLAARAIDPRGSGRVPTSAVAAACERIFSARQFRRLLGSPGGERYWERDRHLLRLRAAGRIAASYPEEVLISRHARRFPLELLNSRPRRGAALVAAMLACVDTPCSNVFISRFASVDRQTVSRWMHDPAIKANVLERVPESATR